MLKKLIREYEMTQEELSKIIGKSRPAIANSIRLLSLPKEIQKFVISGELSSGHARALITIEDRELQFKIAEEIIKSELTVRQAELLVKKAGEKKPVGKQKAKDENFMEIEERLKNIFGTKVQLFSNKKRGKIMIEYYSNDELDRILDLVNSIGQK